MQNTNIAYYCSIMTEKKPNSWGKTVKLIKAHTKKMKTHFFTDSIQVCESPTQFNVDEMTQQLWNYTVGHTSTLPFRVQNPFDKYFCHVGMIRGGRRSRLPFFKILISPFFTGIKYILGDKKKILYWGLSPEVLIKSYLSGDLSFMNTCVNYVLMEACIWFVSNVNIDKLCITFEVFCKSSFSTSA